MTAEQLAALIALMDAKIMLAVAPVKESEAALADAEAALDLAMTSNEVSE